MGRSKKSQAKKREKQKKLTDLKKKKKIEEKKTGKRTTTKENSSVQSEPADASTSQPSKPKYDVEQLLQKADEYIDTLEYELAQKFCQRALDVDGNNIAALETAGTVFIELGDVENAVKYFNKAVTLSPGKGFSKYMYLGQLCEGKEAIECFQKGVDLMLQERDEQAKLLEGACANPEETVTVTNQDISRAYCSMAEIYLTDSCFEEDAEQHCKACLEKAIETDADNAEAHQLHASYLLSVEKLQDAKAAIEKSISLWLPQWREHLEKSENSEAFEMCPLSYEVRVSTAKILIEVQLFQEALEVLDGLLEEDDEVVEVWYLIGWCYHQSQLEDKNKLASYYLTKAKQIFTKVGCDDDPMLEHIEELLNTLGPVEELDDDGAAMETDDGDSDDDDDDVSSSEDETCMEH